jgi:hypothetical protein
MASDKAGNLGNKVSGSLPSIVPSPQPQVPADPKAPHCDIIAHNEALNAGYNPNAQNGTNWDGNTQTVADIYGQYPDIRNTTPQAGTAGYVFYDSPTDNDTIPEHMEFYDYTGGGDTYTIQRTDGIETPTPRDYPSTYNYGTFVPLNSL